MEFRINDLSYHVEICGEGFPLLMLHGFTGRGSNWFPFSSSIGKFSKMIMPDILGHGSTKFIVEPVFHEEVIIEREARVFINILDQLGYDKVDILGYSMGGRLAISMAILFPDRVRKLVLESTTPGIKSDKERFKRKLDDFLLGGRIAYKGIEKFVDYWENIPLFESQKSLPQEVRDSIRKQRLMNDPMSLGESLYSLSTGAMPSYWESLHEIQADVLMIVGELDRKFCQIAEEMQKNLQNGKIIKVNHAGHAIHVEQPEIFGTIVSDFLSNT